jgi:hypothetical protein
MVYYKQHYVIDWDKVQTLEDMKLLFKAVQISFAPNNPHIAEIMHLVKLEDRDEFNGYLTAAEEPPAESE